MGNTLKNGASVKLRFKNSYLAQVVKLRQILPRMGKIWSSLLQFKNVMLILKSTIVLGHCVLGCGLKTLSKLNGLICP